VIIAILCAVSVAGGYAALVLLDDDGDIRNVKAVLGDGDLSIHFLELGNKFTGDCVYINYGTIDILIDAGSRTSSSSTITRYIKNYIQDDKIEYVIATHAHQDHIAGFYSTKTTKGVLDSFEIGTIIDYPLTNSDTVTRTNYENTRDKLVRNGTEHYTALDCYNNVGGAQSEYILGQGVKLEILYQPFYESKTSNENNYSVCVMITQDDKQYLFTGDLEAEGESGLVDHYEKEGGLGKCVLYKGGHHGSSTSSTNKLLNMIKPEYVVVCTCAGTSEYTNSVPNQFPTQAFIDRIAPHTDKEYVTTLITDYKNNKYRPLNGNVVFVVSANGDMTVVCSNNDKILKDTDWFRNNRTMPNAW
jgi:competence protein ComEC